jgi:hypothetical protein
MTATPTAHEEVYISVDVETAGPIPATYSLLSCACCAQSIATLLREFQPITKFHTRGAGCRGFSSC